MTTLNANTFSTASSIKPAAASRAAGSTPQEVSALARPAAHGLGFVEWLGKSNFSFLQGASHPEEMVLQAKALGYQGLCLCDLNGLYGVVRAHCAIHRPSHFIVDSRFTEGATSFSFFCGAEMQLSDQSSIALVPLNKDGYAQLCRLITLAKRTAPKGFSCLQLKDVLAHADHLMAMPLPPWNQPKIEKLIEAFGDRLYLPVWQDYSWESLQLFHQACQLERDYGLALFATGRPLMHDRHRKPLHDVLTCILHQTTLEKAKTLLLANSERHLKPLDELQSLWKDRTDLLARTKEMADRVQFSLEELSYQYPHATVPQGQTSDQYLRQLVEAGLKQRYPQGTPPDLSETVEKELGLIRELNYEDYFLTLWDVCQFAKQRGILCQGRGSAANSVVCYALGLTAVDPSCFQLMFERFLSKERGEPPDIDIDFESERREEVIQYIYQKYGPQHAAMVCTVVCYRSRMALRETAKALGLPLNMIDHLGRLMGREGFQYLLDHPEKLKQAGLNEKRIRQLLRITQQLIGFPRHLGIHTGGFLISQRPLSESVPVEKATMADRYVIQWNKDDLDFLKMMKVDVLGLGMLTALQKTFVMLKEKKGLEFNLYNIPPDDPPTYRMIQKAETVGVFQIESRAQMSLLPRVNPKNFYDLVVEVAIIRPGPLQGGLVHPYIRRRHGLEKVRYPHPDLEKILAKTLGVPIFQEQIMQIASTVCGFTPGEADELRRVMSSSWKHKDVMSGLRHRLISGMLSHGLNRRDAEVIYKTIEGFAAYGFPESHAASFALITYASCYLKCHHPDVFVTALLNSQPMGFYSPRTLISDAQRRGVKFRPIDVQHSFYDYTLEEFNHALKEPCGRVEKSNHSMNNKTRLAVRQGFRSIYGLAKKHIEPIAQERLNHGPYKSFADFIQRTHLPKNILIRLAAANAFSSLQLNARQALWKIQALELDDSSLLFGFAKETFNKNQVEEAQQADLPEESGWQSLNRQYQVQGFSLAHHPMALLRPALNQLSQQLQKHKSLPFITSKTLKNGTNDQTVRVAGLLCVKQKPPTAKGFAFLTLEDEEGFFNIILRPDVYKQYRQVINFHPLMEIEGTLQKAQGVLNIKAQRLKALPIRWLLNLHTWEASPDKPPPNSSDSTNAEQNVLPKALPRWPGH